MVTFASAVFFLVSAAEASETVNSIASCPSANGAAMLQLSTLDLKAQAAETDTSMGKGLAVHRTVAVESNRGRSLAAYNVYLQHKVAALSVTKQPAVTELNDLIEHFISQQSNSEDKCSSQLLETKHQLNELHVTINDLAAEINSTETSIQVTNIELTTKREELEVIETWKVTELTKCEEIREEHRRMLYILQQEVIEMQHIARPDVTMDIAGGTVSTGVSLLEEGTPEKVSSAQALVRRTKTAASLLKQCVQASSAPSRPPVGLAQSRNTTEVSKTCLEQKEYLEKIYVTTYVELTRLVSEHEELIRSRSCEDTVIQEYDVKVTPIRKVIDELVIRIEMLTTKLQELRPRLQDAYVAESKLREQITALTEECTSLPETVTDLDKVREVILSLDKCPGLGAAEFNIPVWTGEWVVVRQTSSQSDAVFDALMNQACLDKFGESGAHSVRVAEVSEIYAVAIEGMPRTNTAEEAIVGACPLCAGLADADTGAEHPDGHARVCWQTGAALSLDGASKECSTGSRAVLCVWDRGNIRNSTSSSSSSSSSGSNSGSGSNSSTNSDGSSSESGDSKLCKATTIKFTLNGNQQSYDLPAADLGQASRTCKFGDMVKGDVVFSCGAAGRWGFASHSCKTTEQDTDDSLERTCKTTSLTHTLNGHKHTYELPASNEGELPPRDCFFGDMTAGSVRYACGATGQWSLLGHSCHVEGQVCAATKFSLTLQDQSNEYDLPAAPAGDASRPCQFGDLTEGEVKFKCSFSSGKWSFASHSCQKPGDDPSIEVEMTCPGAQATYSINGNSHTYELPASTEGELSPRDCLFGDLTEGFIRFACTNDGRYTVLGQDCKRPGEVCKAASFGVTVGSNKHTYSLPSSGLGETARTCAFGDLTEGDINFNCADDGQWTVAGNTCKKSGQVLGKVCAAREFGMTINANQHTYALPAADAGQLSRPCQFGDLTDGEINFQCSIDGTWSFTDHSCKTPGVESGDVCQATSISLRLSGHAHTYALPGAAVGEVSRDCEFGDLNQGMIKFSCGATGHWSYVSHACQVSGHVCKNTRMTITGIAGDSSRITFELSAGPPGVVAASCGDGSTGVGEAKFECLSSGSWQYQSGTSTCQSA